MKYLKAIPLLIGVVILAVLMVALSVLVFFYSLAEYRSIRIAWNDFISLYKEEEFYQPFI